MMKNQSNKKRILIALYYYYPYISGVSVYANRLAEGFVKAGHEVTVLTSRHDKSLPHREIINGVTILRRPVLLKLGKGVIMPTLWFDIIRHSFSHHFINPHLPLAESGISSLFIPKHKIITTYQCDINLGPRLHERILTFISLKLMALQLKRSKVIVPLAGDYLAHSKMRKYVFKSRPINPPIPATTFKHVASESLFNKLQVKKSEVKIGFVGRIVYEKGIEYLLESIPYIKKRYPAFKIIIAGDYEKIAGGSIKQKLDIYLKQYPDHIVFTGFLTDEEVVQFYSGINVLVLPSIDPLEAFGMVQVEAMLCGTPVVASNLPGVRTVVQTTGYGKISKLKDPENIAKQVIEVVSRTKKYFPDRDRVAQLYNPRNTIENYERLMS